MTTSVKCFLNTTLVTDRFHVQKIATEPLQEIIFKYRLQNIDRENEHIEKAKKKVYTKKHKEIYCTKTNQDGCQTK